MASSCSEAEKETRSLLCSLCRKTHSRTKRCALVADKSVIPELRTGDRIIKVDGVSIDQLPPGCIQNNVLVSPIGKSSDYFAVTVQRVTFPGCDEVLALLQQPLQMCYCFPSNETSGFCDMQSSSLSSSCSSRQLRYQSTSTSMSSHGSGQSGGGHKAHSQDNDKLCQKSDYSQPIQSYQYRHLKHLPASSDSHFLSTSLPIVSFPQSSCHESQSLPKSLETQMPLVTQPPLNGKSSSHVDLEEYSSDDTTMLVFPILQKYNAASQGGEKLQSCVSGETPMKNNKKRSGEKFIKNATSLDFEQSFEAITDDEVNTASVLVASTLDTAVGTFQVVSTIESSSDENTMDVHSEVSRPPMMSQINAVQRCSLPRNLHPGLPGLFGHEKKLNEVKKFVVLPGEPEDDQSSCTGGKLTKVDILSDGGGDVGISLVGGRGNGLFIQSIADGSPVATSCLLHDQDEVLEINGQDITMATYEEGTLAIKSCPATVSITVRANQTKFRKMLSSNLRDTFFIRTLFSNIEYSVKNSLSFSCGDVLCVVDTVYEDQVGSWYAYKLSPGGNVFDQGVIPSQQRACQLISHLGNEGESCLDRPMVRRRSKQVILGRAKSIDVNQLGGRLKLKECAVKGSAIYDRNIIGYQLAMTKSTLFRNGSGTYCCVERSSFKFLRPVVLLGSVAMQVTESLCKSSVETLSAYCRPDEMAGRLKSVADNDSDQQGIICGSVLVSIELIKEASRKGYHCVMNDVHVDGIRELLSVGLHPIVIYFDQKNHRKASRLPSEAGNDKNKLISLGLLSATLKSGCKLQKTVDRTMTLVSILQTSLYWLPSQYQFLAKM